MRMLPFLALVLLHGMVILRELLLIAEPSPRVSILIVGLRYNLLIVVLLLCLSLPT